MPKLVFFDTEVRSKADIGKDGVMRYARDPSTHWFVISAYFADARYGVWMPEWARAGLKTGFSEWLRDAWNEAIEDEETFFVAWNAQFDRLIMQETSRDLGFKPPPLERTLCAMAQAENYSLPGNLGKAAITLGVPVQKDTRGKRLIRTLCNGHQPWEPDPQDIADFATYAMKDTLAMREVWNRCRPWTGIEWHDYHVLERINARGIRVDLPFARVAVGLSEREKQTLNCELQALTGDAGITLTHSKRKTAWLHEQLDGTPFEEVMWVTTKRKAGHTKALSAGKPVQHALRELYEDLSERGDVEIDGDTWAKVDEFLDILDRGNGVAAVKFSKMLQTHYNGVLYQQFRCSPTITGRHAARGVQFDNVLRDKLKKLGFVDDHPALVAVDWLMVNGETGVDALEAAFELPITKILARLIRPSIIAENNEWLVWGDLNAIEARVLPWLANAEHYLNLFREDVDVYCREAINIFDLRCTWQELKARASAGDPEAVYQRLIGKVTVLALGYQGGQGALMKMARGYGLRLAPAFAERVKVKFRAKNTWLVRFWSDLDDAIWRAVAEPGTWTYAGRLRYYRKGPDLYCFLPCGRPIVYPRVDIEERYKARFNDVIECITYRKMWSGQPIRGELYPGVAVENADQGTAASLLRDIMRRLDRRGMPVIAPKHDEILMRSCDPARDAAILQQELVAVPSWAEGLPLEAEVEYGSFYGK